jgi:predicted glycosyltransferase
MAHDAVTRALFYVQHLLGIGHLARASLIADAMVADGFDVTVVTGGMPVPGFPGKSVAHVALPAVTASDQGFSGLVDAEGAPVGPVLETTRRELLLKAFQDLRPDILIVEAFPFGRRQMRFELLPLLEAARNASGKSLVVSSIRDILQERSKPGRNEETVDLVTRYFDLVMVHGDADFLGLEQSFPLVRALGDTVAYTGLVAAAPAPAADEKFDVVISAGGGAAGQALVAAAVDAAAILPASLSWCLITGPNLPKAALDGSRLPGNVQVEPFRTDFRSLLASCRLSISQAGYNTVCDVLQAGCRSVLVPFAAGGETEQSMRAARLAELRLATVVPEAGITGTRLASAISAALASPPRAPHELPLDGAQRSAEILRSRLALKRRRSA